MVETFGFNTGRLYASDGQRISYAIVLNTRVYFNDHSRMISGKIRGPFAEAFAHISPESRARIIMARYDACEYDYDNTGTAQALNAGEWPAMRVTNN